MKLYMSSHKGMMFYVTADGPIQALDKIRLITGASSAAVMPIRDAEHLATAASNT